MVRMLYWWHKDFPHPFRAATKRRATNEEDGIIDLGSFLLGSCFTVNHKKNYFVVGQFEARLKVKWVIPWKSKKYPRMLMNHRVRSMRLKTLLSISISASNSMNALGGVHFGRLGEFKG